MPIDLIESGERLNQIIKRNRCSVKELQIILKLSCPQPIYRWIKGSTLPSVENLYTLSRIFEMHMEDMLVAKRIETSEKRQLIDTTIKLIDSLVKSNELY